MSDTQEFAYYNNNGEDEASSRSDIREVEEAFKKAKTRLYFKTQGDIDETLAVVGPQEHLDDEIDDMIKIIKDDVKTADSVSDDIPRKVLVIVEGVVTKAKDGETSSSIATQNLDTTKPAYTYGREAMADLFDLRMTGREKLTGFDDKLRELFGFRINTKMEESDSALQQCYMLLNEAEEESRRDRGNLDDRISSESSMVQVSDLDKIYYEAKGDLDEEAREDDNIEKNCSKDIAKLDDEMSRIISFAESSKQNYNQRAQLRELKLRENRKTQADYHEKLKRLEEEEKRLVEISKDEDDCQEVADAALKETLKNFNGWKQQIQSLQRKATTALLIIKDMHACTELILSHAKKQKTRWLEKLDLMEVDSLLQLRDSLIAKASLNKMELEDCQDILNNIETDLAGNEAEKRKWGQKGYRDKVEKLKEEIQSLSEKKQEMETKKSKHAENINNTTKELKDIDGLIKQKNASLHLDTFQSRYEALQRAKKKVFEKDDVGQMANFSSNIKYKS